MLRILVIAFESDCSKALDLSCRRPRRSWAARHMWWAKRRHGSRVATIASSCRSRRHAFVSSFFLPPEAARDVQQCLVMMESHACPPSVSRPNGALRLHIFRV